MTFTSGKWTQTKNLHIFAHRARFRREKR